MCVGFGLSPKLPLRGLSSAEDLARTGKFVIKPARRLLYLEIFTFVRGPAATVLSRANSCCKSSGSLRLSLTEKAVQPASDPRMKLFLISTCTVDFNSNIILNK